MEKLTLEEITEWVKNTCLLFGAETHTAYEVAALFAKGLAREWEKNHEARTGEAKGEG